MRHRFAAILAADVARFSTRMEDDAETTVHALQNCRDLFQRCVEAHSGCEFGSVGDSFMAEFPSAVEALRAARDFQAQLDAANVDVDEQERLQVRLGLHAGDVISEGDELFGDVVNTAARLQQFAKPGGIATSQFVHQQVHKEPGFAFRDLGKHHLKNIAEPVAVFEVAKRKHLVNWRRVKFALLPYRVALAAVAGVIIAGVLLISYIETRERPGIGGTIKVPPENSIAVLPFNSPAANEESRILAAGMHADILTQLAKIGAFDKVISRTSMEQYRDTDKPVAAIASELGVATILEGGVQRAGDQIRINVELIDAASDHHLWAETYDRDLTAENIFLVQSEIARSVAAALQLAITAEESDRLTSLPTTSLDAYNEFVWGEQEMARITVDSMRKAVAHFETAIELDPGYADAYVGLSDALTMQRGYVFDDTLPDTRPRQRDAIDRALELDPASGRAYAALGSLYRHENDYEEAERSFVRAIELTPNSADAHLWYSVLLRQMGRLDEALVHSGRALELVPNPPPVFNMNVSRQLFDSGQWEAAKDLLLESVKKDPEFVHYYFDMARQLKATGRVGDAMRWANEGLRIHPRHRFLHGTKCALLAELGDGQAAERCVDSYEDRFSQKIDFERIGALILQDDIEGLVEFNERLIRRDGHRDLVAAIWLLLSRPERARPVLESLVPEFFGDADVVVTRDNMWSAPRVGCLLYDDGRTDRANRLIDQGIGQLRPGSSIAAIFEIGTSICKGDKDGAISILRDVVDVHESGGWLLQWWTLRFPSVADAMRDKPEWQALMVKLEADIAAERQWYEEHKHEPLF